MLDFVLPTEKDRDSVLDFYDEIEKTAECWKIHFLTHMTKPL